MTQKLVAIDAGGGNQLPLLYVDPYGVALQTTDPAGTWEQDCCCGCDSFLHCLACLDEHTYTSSQTVNWPADVESCDIICWGHGGKGGNSSAAGEAAGGGGGGGVAVAWEVSKNSGSSSLSLIINDVSNGYATEVKQDGDTVCIADAGEDGGDGPDGTGGPGGGGGSGVFVKSGGSGADGDKNSHAGGGGGGAGDLVAGSDANGAEGGKGGYRKGGDGGSATGTKAGKNYGGGGAGGYGGAQGGAGGNGLVRIYWRRPMTMNLTIAGAPSSSVDCHCNPPQVPNIQDIKWDALNRPFSLKQRSAGSISFEWKANKPCDDSLRNGSDAIQIETRKTGSCDINADLILDETEYYVVGVTADINCSDGRMYLANVSFDLCECSRHKYQLNNAWYWTDWGCSGSGSYTLLCGTGENIRTAAPCTRGTTMEVEMLWPTLSLNSLNSCQIEEDCYSPTIGTATATLGC